MNALLSREELPVGTPIDAFKAIFDANGRCYYSLREYTWIWVVAEGTHSLYDGPHIYPWETVRVLVEDNFIQPSAETLPLGWRPTRTFASADLQQAWTVAKKCGANKQLILATIGLWTKQESYQYYARRTDCEGDIPGPVTVKTFRHDGTIMMTQTEMWDNITCLPFALLPLFDEQRYMYRARQIVAMVPEVRPIGCMVDGLFCLGTPEAKARLKELVDQEQFPVLETNIFKFKDATAASLEGLPLEQLRNDNRSCYKPTRTGRIWKKLTEHDLMEMGREEDLAKLSQVTTEPLDKAQAMAVVVAVENEGGLVSGPAGVGKSQILRAMKVYLESMDQKVITCAYTHCATRLIGGSTIASLLHKNTSLVDTWFLVDEIGLVPISTLGAMSRWTALGARFIFFGDFQGQFAPFIDRWNFKICWEFSPLMESLANGLRIEISKYRRGKDLELFNWFHGMYGQEETAGLVRESRDYYPAACDPMCNPLVLCISHFHRYEVNRIQNERLAPPGALHCQWDGEDLIGATMQPQSMRIWSCTHKDKLDGIHLIGNPRGSGKKLVVQGVIYCVMDITDSGVELQMMSEYCHGAKDERVTVPIEDVCSQLRPTHAMCYYTMQGRTVKNRHLVLLDTSSIYFSVRALIVGLSRVEEGSFLHIGDSTSQGLFVGERKVRQIDRSRD